jgi:hypothetical protein
MPGPGVAAVAVGARIGDVGLGSASAAWVVPAVHGRHVDPLRRRVGVEEAVTVFAHDRVASGSPGNHGRRSAPLRRDLVDGCPARTVVDQAGDELAPPNFR